MTHQHLYLLVHDLAGLGPRRWELRPTIAVHRARVADEAAVLSIDAEAFDPPWRMGRRGLDHALRATPSTHHRVATRGRGTAVLGYAVSGIASDRGYLQRLGVAPGARRGGLGSALVLDALRWMHRRGARDAIVNTQVDNEAALALYLKLGFTLVASDFLLPNEPIDL